MNRRPGIATRSVHPPPIPSGSTVPAAPPLDLSSAWFVPDLDVLHGLAQGKRPDAYYRRYGHPNARQLEGAVLALESPDQGSWDAVAFSAGMSACAAMFWS